MRRVLFALAASALVAGCSNRTDGALRIVVTVDPSLKADCFEVVLSKGAVLAYEAVKREPGVSSYTIGAKQGSMPAIVTVQAKAYLGDCSDAVNRKLNSSSAGVDHAFPTMGVEVVELKLSPPDTTLDNDRDGYADAQKSGPDCDDTDATVHPGSTQACGLAKDTNCDGKYACQDPDCQSEPSCQSPATKLAFVPATATFLRGACSQDVVLEVHDAQGAITPVALDTTIALTTSDPKVLVVSGSCTGSPVTSVMIPYNQSSVRLKVRSTVAGAQTVTAAATGVASGTLALDVRPIPTAALVFTSAAQSLKAGDCSAPVTVELRDAANGVTTAAADTALGLSTTATASFDFFAASDTTCATPLTAPATITVQAGQSGGSFRVRSTRAALPNSTFTLGVHDSAGSTPDTQVLTVAPNVASALVFTSSPPGLQQTNCSTSPVRIEVQDAFGNTSTVAAATTLALSTTPALTPPDYFTFYKYAGTTVACTTAVSLSSPATIAAGTSGLSLAIKAKPIGTYVMTAAAPGSVPSLTAGTQTAVIVAGPPNHISITTAPQTVTAGGCSGVVTVQAQDANNTPSGPGADVQVTVTPTNGVVGYSDSSCLTPLTGGKFTIFAGTTSGAFYFGGNTSGGTTLTLSSSLNNASQTETIAPGPPAKLVWGTPNTATVAAGGCSTALQLLVQDALGNAATYSTPQILNLSSTPGGPTFSTAVSTCAGAGSSVSGVTGPSVTVYATYTALGTYAISGVIGAFSSLAPNATLTVNPGAATQLVYKTAPPASTVAGACNKVDVDRKDAQGNLAPVASPTATALTATATSGTTPLAPQFFATAADCTAGAPAVASVSMPTNQATVSFWVRGRSIGTSAIKASQGLTTDASAPMIITSSTATQLRFVSLQGSVTAGVCTANAAVERDDAFGNPVTQDATPLSVVITATGAASGPFTVSTSGSCGSAGSNPVTVTIQASTASAPFGGIGTLAGAVTLTGTSSLPTPANGTLTVTAAAVSKIVITSPPQSANPSVVSAVCSAATTVQSQDQYGNPSNPSPSALAVNLTANNTIGTLGFYSDSWCTVAATSVPINTGGNTAQFYFKATKAETVTVTATTTAPASSSTLAWLVTPGAANKLAFKAVTQPTSGTAFACGATPLTLQVQDAQGNPTSFTGSRTFRFTPSAPAVGMLFSASNACAGVFPGVPAQNVYTSPSEFLVYLLPTGTGTTTVAVSDVTGVGTPLVSTPASVPIVVTGTPGSLAVSASSPQVEYGGCQAVQVQRFNGATPWTVGTTSVTLSGGTGDLSVHNTSACSTPTPTSVTATADIADGLSTVTFYVKGHSAPANTTVTVTAADGAGAYSSGTLNVTPLPLVRRGTCTLTATTSTVSCTVTPPIPANNISRTFLVFQARAPGSAPSDQAVECHLTSASSVTVDCTRFGAAGDATVQWQTVSFANSYANGGVSVTHRTLTGSTLTGTGAVDTIGPPMNLGNTFLLFSEATSDTAFNMANTTTGFLSSATQATFNSGGTGFPASIQLSYEVVQMSGSSVDRGQEISGMANASFNVTGQPSHPNGTMAMLHSVRFSAGTDTTDVCRKRYRAFPRTSGGNVATDISFFRGDGLVGTPCTDVAPSEVDWERVQFPAGTSVQWTQVNVDGAAQSADSTGLTAVWPHRSLLFMSGQGPGGQNSGETNVKASDLGFSQGTVDFSASCGVSTCAILTVTRGSPGSAGLNASFEPYVVQFSP